MPMTRTSPELIEYYDKEVSRMIAEKYGYTLMEALRLFVFSETHELLENQDMGLTMFAAFGVFDIWEAERITGDPRRSVFIRCEA